MEDDLFERLWQENPESKLELIDGQLIVGNGLEGSRYLLREILTGWGPAAAIPFAPLPLWWRALTEGFRDHEPPSADAPLAAWETWATATAFTPRVGPAGPRDDPGHRAARDRVRFGLYEITREEGLGQSLGPDFVMRLGENGFTPDVLVVSPERRGALRDYYLDGPADIAIEVLLPGHEDQDRALKRRYYAAGEVLEYWIVDPLEQRFDPLRLVDGTYRSQPVSGDGRYRPESVPGVALVLERLWSGLEEDRWGLAERDAPVFEVEERPPAGTVRRGGGGVCWGDLPFHPQPGLEPRAIRFAEFISWCGRAKFEMVGGKPLIDGTIGTRNVLGMLLRTFGLAGAVTVMTPSDWVEALEATRRERTRDAGRRERWWREVREVGAFLHDRYRFRRVAVIGDLTREEPLDVWSGVTLVVWDVPEKVSLSRVYDEIYERNRDTCIVDLRRFEFTTRAQKEEIESGAVEI